MRPLGSHKSLSRLHVSTRQPPQASVSTSSGVLPSPPRRSFGLAEPVSQSQNHWTHVKTLLTWTNGIKIWIELNWIEKSWDKDWRRREPPTLRINLSSSRRKNNIPQSTTDNLINSRPRRCQAVIDIFELGSRMNLITMNTSWKFIFFFKKLGKKSLFIWKKNNVLSVLRSNTVKNLSSIRRLWKQITFKKRHMHYFCPVLYFELNYWLGKQAWDK